MLIAARKVRGSSHLTDAVLPLAILDLAQAESLMNGFAINLVLSSLIAIALIVFTATAREGDGRRVALCFGIALVMLPLCGGSGLVLLPPLGLWLAGYSFWGWWSAKKPGVWMRMISLGLLLVGSIIVLLYLRDYTRPSHHPLPPSARAVVSSTLMYLSLGIYPQIATYWWPSGPIVVILVAATLVLLTIKGVRTPADRPRALGLLAFLLSMLCLGLSIAVSRAGLGSAAILSSRYITLATPLFCVLYVSWLVYGNPRARLGVHLCMIALICSASPRCSRFSRDYGASLHALERRVERSLINHSPRATLMRQACPALHSDAKLVDDGFRMLQAARVGAFAELRDERVGSADGTSSATRR
jgi:hypothetical protein